MIEDLAARWYYDDDHEAGAVVRDYCEERGLERIDIDGTAVVYLPRGGCPYALLDLMLHAVWGDSERLADVYTTAEGWRRYAYPEGYHREMVTCLRLGGTLPHARWIRERWRDPVIHLLERPY